MTDDWQHIGRPAEAVRDRVEQMKSPAVPDNVIPFPQKQESEQPQLPDPRSLEYQDAVGQFAEGLYRLCSRAEKHLGIHSVRGVVAAVLTEIDEQIEKNGGGGAA
jgi:hypothetical protein